MIKAFVTGFPIKHSKSPLLHGHWLQHYAIAGTYEALEVSPDNFSDFLKGLKDSPYIGGNITIPHKEAALASIEKLDSAADLIGAANTVWLEDDILLGTNTDAYGFAANLDEYAPEWRGGKSAIVLGAGGASRAVIFAILEAGYGEVHIVNRTYSRAKNLAERFGERCYAHEWQELQNLMPSSDLIVNTTSLGMSGSEENSETPMPDMSLAQSGAIVTDIVYTPLETPILRDAKKHGLKTVDGLGMLLHQAVPGFEKWFGTLPEVTKELRTIILDQST